MSKSLKLVVTLGLVALVAACAQQEEEPMVMVEPIVAEPVYTKY